MKIIESFFTENPCYKANQNPGTDSRYLNFQKNGPQGLMLHSVGFPQPNASAFRSSWNQSTFGRACVHAFIDANDGTIYQCLPWNYRGWHGGGASNNTHIGVEMCEPDCIKYSGGATFTCSEADKSRAKKMVTTAYNAAVELFAMLCQKYNLDPMKDGVILSHKEGNHRGIADGHVDPEHLWDQLGMGYTMDGFRKDVSAKMGIKIPDEQPSALKPGDIIKIVNGAKYTNGFSIPSWVINSTCYYRDKTKEGIVFSILKAGDITGVIDPKYIENYSVSTPVTPKPTHAPTPAPSPASNEYKNGDIIKLSKDTRYTNGQKVPDWVINSTCYYRGKDKSGVIFSILKTGDITGVIDSKYIINTTASETPKPTEFKPYMVKIVADALNYREGPGTSYKVNGTIRDHGVYTIVKESNGWGFLKSGAGWIALNYTQKV